MAEKPKKVRLEFERKLPKPPFWLVSTFLILIVGSWIPLVAFERSRFSTSTEPRVQLMQDMGAQPKYKTQTSSAVFADGRAMRPHIAGTVARNDLELDDHYYRGFTQTVDPKTEKYVFTYYADFPKQVTVNEQLLKRGQARFNIYCAVCHGYDGGNNGRGDGMVARRALELGTAWIPADLHKPAIVAQPVGQIFNTITNGIRTMPSYADQIPVEDRWAIVAYVRALQMSQDAPARIVPQERLQTLR